MPNWSIMSSGSITLPIDFDIFRPCGVAHEAVDHTSRNGTSPMSVEPDMTIRATQKKRMS